MLLLRDLHHVFAVMINRILHWLCNLTMATGWYKKWHTFQVRQ